MDPSRVPAAFVVGATNIIDPSPLGEYPERFPATLGRFWAGSARRDRSRRSRDRLQQWLPWSTRTRRLLTGAAAFALGAVALAGCGDDDGDGPGASAGAFCDAALAFETVPDPEIDFETATDDEIGDGLSAYARDTLRPLAERLQTTAPDEVADIADALLEVVDEVAATGDPAPFEDPEFVELSAEGEAFTDEECGWTRQEITAVDYAYEGLPERVDAGVARFAMVNEGEELHEIALFRKDEGVTASAEELLALPEGEVEEQVTFVAQVLAEPGDTGSGVVDLEPGEYVAVCFVPVGTTSEEVEVPETPRPTSPRAWSPSSPSNERSSTYAGASQHPTGPPGLRRLRPERPGGAARPARRRRGVARRWRRPAQWRKEGKGRGGPWLRPGPRADRWHPTSRPA